jgi:tetratricopeptide (TPR) repeat protein
MFTTNPHLQRAHLLLSQRRYDLAESEVRQAIAAEPNEPLGYAFLALCLGESKHWQAATEAAQRAIALGPDEPYHHYVHAHIFLDRNMFKEARAAIEESLRLEPEDADAWALGASIDLAQKRYREALDAANRGLEIDAEHEDCINVRAVALTNLGDRSAAGAAIVSTLARNPENATSHANMGWTLLHAGDPKAAMISFREALRLDPELEWARAGIVEAMKARSPIYRIFLAYFLFMARLPAQAQWGILIGGYVAMQVLRSVRRSNPDLAVFLTPLIIAYMVFALGTIVSVPLFNLLLFLNRFGRHALRRDQRWAAAIFGISLIPPATFLALWASIGGSHYKLSALLSGLLIIPISLAGLVRPGRPRLIMSLVAGVIGLTCLIVCSALIAAFHNTTMLKFVHSIVTSNPGAANTFTMVYVLACLLSTWLANALNSASAPTKR